MEKHKLVQYIELGLSAYKIAEVEKVSYSTIRYWLNKYELVTKTNMFNIKNIDDKYKCIKCKESELSEFNKRNLCVECENKYIEIRKENKRMQIKYSNKKVNAKKEKIPFELTILEFIQLAEEVNITSKDMTIKGYHLARINDTGSYKIGNCRFIYYKDNYKERKTSDNVRRASAINIKKAFAELNGENKSIHIQSIKDGRKKWWEGLSEKEKEIYLLNNFSFLSEKEIKRRHDIIKQIPNKFGRLTKASKVLKLTPQVIGRFLKQHPLIE